jgi:hypothetical protein
MSDNARKSRRIRAKHLLLAVAAALLITGCGPASAPGATAPPAPPTSSAPATAATAVVKPATLQPTPEQAAQLTPAVATVQGTGDGPAESTDHDLHGARRGTAPPGRESPRSCQRTRGRVTRCGCSSWEPSFDPCALLSDGGWSASGTVRNTDWFAAARAGRCCPASPERSNRMVGARRSREHRRSRVD